MTKKYEVKDDLKAIFAECKTSSFSLTSLFDSKDFKREDEQENEREDDKFDQRPQIVERKQGKSEVEEDEQNESEVEEDDQNETDFQNGAEEDVQNEDENETREHDHRSRAQLNIPKVKELFFFRPDDERFERLKFYDPSKIEKHNQDWDKQKFQLLQAMTRRRKSMKKKDHFNQKRSSASSKPNKQQYKKLRTA